MLDNMRHSRAVVRRGAESDIKYFVFVIIRNDRNFCAALFMAQDAAGGMDVGKFLLFYNFICSQI